MSAHIALPREGHLEQMFHIVGYLKSHEKMRILWIPRSKRELFQEYD